MVFAEIVPAIDVYPITHTLLPRAFSKYTRVYAYIDTKNHWLVLDTITPSKVEKFLNLFKKTFSEVNCQCIDTQKIAPLLTRWLKHNNVPPAFEIEKTGVLKDSHQQGRMIRCQQQDLQAPGIQSLLKDGYEVHQLSLNWQEKMRFVLVDDFTLKSICYQR